MKANTLRQSVPITKMERDSAVRYVEEAVDCLNAAISRAVDANVSVELALACRYHNGCGNWGDQMKIVLKEPFSAE